MNHAKLYKAFVQLKIFRMRLERQYKNNSNRFLDIEKLIFNSMKDSKQKKSNNKKQK